MDQAYRYDVPFGFTGRLNKLTLRLEPQQRTTEKRRIMRALGQRNHNVSE